MITLYNQDCLEVMKAMPDKSVDLVLTDMPYGETNEDWDNEPNYKILCPEIERILKDDGITILFGKFRNLSNFYQTTKLNWFCEWIWEKPKSAFTQYHLPIWVHEQIHIYRKNNSCINKINIDSFAEYSKPYIRRETATSSKTRGNGRGGMKPVTVQSIDGKRHPRSVIYHNTAGMNEGEMGHLTPKPINLVGNLIKSYSLKNNIVADCFMGSGTTGVACVQLERNFIGCEISKEYYDISVARINEAQNTLFNLATNGQNKIQEIQTDFMTSVL